MMGDISPTRKTMNKISKNKNSYPDWAQCVSCWDETNAAIIGPENREFELLQTYRNRDFYPLPCCHFVCSKECLERCRRKPPNGCDAPPSQFRCPKCEILFEDLSDIQRMQTMRPLEAAGLIPTKMFKIPKRCDGCIRPLAVAAKFCKDCSGALCELCIKQHEAVESTMNHLLISSQNLQYSVPKSDVCQIHQTQRLNFYCTTCDLAMCDICYEGHLDVDHSVSHLDDCVATASKHLSSMSKTHNKCIEQLGNIMRTRIKEVEAGWKQEIEAMNTDIRQIFQRLVNSLEQRQNTLAEEVVNAIGFQVARHNMQLAMFRTVIQHAQHFVEVQQMFTAMIKKRNKNPSLIHRLYKTIMNEVPRLRKRISTLLGISIFTTTLTMDSEKMFQDIGSIGDIQFKPRPVDHYSSDSDVEIANLFADPRLPLPFPGHIQIENLIGENQLNENTVFLMDADSDEENFQKKIKKEPMNNVNETRDEAPADEEEIMQLESFEEVAPPPTLVTIKNEVDIQPFAYDVVPPEMNEPLVNGVQVASNSTVISANQTSQRMTTKEKTKKERRKIRKEKKRASKRARLIKTEPQDYPDLPDEMVNTAEHVIPTHNVNEEFNRNPNKNAEQLVTDMKPLIRKSLPNSIPTAAVEKQFSVVGNKKIHNNGSQGNVENEVDNFWVSEESNGDEEFLANFNPCPSPETELNENHPETVLLDPVTGFLLQVGNNASQVEVDVSDGKRLNFQETFKSSNTFSDIVSNLPRLTPIQMVKTTENISTRIGKDGKSMINEQTKSHDGTKKLEVSQFKSASQMLAAIKSSSSNSSSGTSKSKPESLGSSHNTLQLPKPNLLRKSAQVPDVQVNEHLIIRNLFPANKQPRSSKHNPKSRYLEVLQLQKKTHHEEIPSLRRFPSPTQNVNDAQVSSSTDFTISSTSQQEFKSPLKNKKKVRRRTSLNGWIDGESEENDEWDNDADYKPSAGYSRKRPASEPGLEGSLADRHAKRARRSLKMPDGAIDSSIIDDIFEQETSTDTEVILKPRSASEQIQTLAGTVAFEIITKCNDAQGLQTPDSSEVHPQPEQTTPGTLSNPKRRRRQQRGPRNSNGIIRQRSNVNVVSSPPTLTHQYPPKRVYKRRLYSSPPTLYSTAELNKPSPTPDVNPPLLSPQMSPNPTEQQSPKKSVGRPRGENYEINQKTRLKYMKPKPLSTLHPLPAANDNVVAEANSNNDNE